MKPSPPARTSRLAAGLSAQAVARRLGWTVPHLLAVERGAARWTLDAALCAARLYGCRVQELLPHRGGVSRKAAREGGTGEQGRSRRRDG